MKNFKIIAQTAYGAFFALILPLFVMISSEGCSKYTTDKELQEALDENSTSVAQAIYDSLSHIYNGVEVYSGSTAGGDPAPQVIMTNSDGLYDGGQHYRTLKIPGGLKPGDKVFVVAEIRFTRSGSSSAGVYAQSVISVTHNATTHPNPSGTQPQPNLTTPAPHLSEVWILENQYHAIDRSGVHIQADTWNDAHVNLHARIYDTAPPAGTTFSVSSSGHRLSVIVVRA